MSRQELIKYLEGKIDETKELIENATELDYMNSLYGRIDGIDTAIKKIKELTDPIPVIKSGDKDTADLIADLLFAFINQDAYYPHDFEIEAFEDAVGYLRNEQYQSSKYNLSLFESHLKQMREVVE